MTSTVEFLDINAREAAALYAVIQYGLMKGAANTTVKEELFGLLDRVEKTHGEQSLLKQLKSIQLENNESGDGDDTKEKQDKQDEKIGDKKEEDVMVTITQPRCNWKMICTCLALWCIDKRGMKHEAKIPEEEQKKMAGYMLDFLQQVRTAVDRANEKPTDSGNADKKD